MPRSTRQSSVARCSICSMRSSPRNRATPAYFTDHYTKLYVQGAAVADSSTPSDGQPQILLNGSSWRFARSRPWSPARDTSLGTCTMTTIANRLVLLWLRRGAESCDDQWADSDGNLDHAIINPNINSSRTPLRRSNNSPIEPSPISIRGLDQQPEFVDRSSTAT